MLGKWLYICNWSSPPCLRSDGVHHNHVDTSHGLHLSNSAQDEPKKQPSGRRTSSQTEEKGVSIFWPPHYGGSRLVFWLGCSPGDGGTYIYVRHSTHGLRGVWLRTGSVSLSVCRRVQSQCPPRLEEALSLSTPPLQPSCIQDKQHCLRHCVESRNSEGAVKAFSC